MPKPKGYGAMPPVRNRFSPTRWSSIWPRSNRRWRAPSVRKTLKLDGTETFDIEGLADGLKPRQTVNLTLHRKDGGTRKVKLLCRIDTLDEIDYFRNGGILHYVLRSLVA